MHRFKSNNGFLFYPVAADAGKDEDVEPVKEDLRIVDVDGSEIHQIGMKIQKADGNYEKFAKTMEMAEKEFRNSCEDLLKYQP